MFSGKTKGRALGSVATAIALDCSRVLYLCVSMDAGSVGPAALSSLRLSYVLFMPSVACPALVGHWHGWQWQREDNKSVCQLAPHDLAEELV